jgi:pimeloyl-ACP methyl ester carboxylesterase
MSDNISNVVLVHGAWADGSSWGTVINSLMAEGLKVVAAPLPLTSMDDDVAALEHALSRVDGPLVLVGHAYAGGVIGNVKNEKVKGLVYVAAHAPDEGETVGQVFGRSAPHPKAPQLSPDDKGQLHLPLEAFVNAFAQNAAKETQELLYAVQRPISLPCITTPVGRPLWKDVPAWYLLAEQDRMVVRETQQFMSSRMRAYVESHDVDHLPSLTAPQVVVDIILRAVAGSAR